MATDSRRSDELKIRRDERSRREARQRTLRIIFTNFQDKSA